MEQFTIHITIGPQSKATFQLTYEEMLKRRLMQYDIVIKVRPKQLVQHFEIDVDIFEPQGISKLDAQASFLSKELAAQTIQKSFSGKKGHVLFRPTVRQQQACPTCSTSLLNGDFKVTYDVNRDKLCDLLVANNYFAHFFAPKNLTNLSKNLVFVIDISGSMEGQKVRQTKEALLKILEDVKPGDNFDLVLFGSQVQSWRGSLVPASKANLQAAQDFVRRFSLAGATNLNGGLLRGIEILNKAQGSHSELSSPASILIMLTDGEPTEGETDRSQILKNVRNAIRGRFPLYNLGFGHDLDFNFLEVMSMENNGWAQRIYEDHDATQQLQGFYSQVANPLLTDVDLQYPQDAVLALTQHKHKQYYDGSEIVVAGRIADHKLSTFKADVRGHGAVSEATCTCVEVTPQKITLNPSSGGPVFSWKDQVTLQKDGVMVTIKKKRNLVVSVEDRATFEIVLHRTWKGSAVHQDFLGFYVLDSFRMSARTQGLLGQFFTPLDFEVSDVRPGSDPTTSDATMVVKNRQLTVTRGLQKDYSKDPRRGTEVSCWFIHNNGAGLIDGVHTDYIVSDIF
ncbi:inter-alpha-trypsin inhibitor heavy chain H1 isoform X3 [Peromyscus californicus insignis]|uniref:inter-alpha-trypsin inhibitor heavy chain H1 isoform X3 n=1 Tax=Peromyscus californicus insignis TaxID=564181 RepID=UPI0022A6C495|nr:inter-alpha-trypsin inhibitor heavy chain H1 isoform X3 [Peromyscus californicus insignis]